MTDYEVEVVTAHGRVTNVDPERLGERLSEFVNGFLKGFDKFDVEPPGVGWHLGEMTLGVAITAEANLRIATGGATTVIGLKFTPKS